MRHSPVLFQDLITASAARQPQACALIAGAQSISYATLNQHVTQFANGLLGAAHLRKGDRVATYLQKTPENVAALFGTARAGGAFVPVNPVLKPEQVGHILVDSGARVLVTSANRLTAIGPAIKQCENLECIVVTGGSAPESADLSHLTLIPWDEFCSAATGEPGGIIIDGDMAAILYTSGSTGLPKGVVLSHRNLVAGAVSVAEYLQNTAEDRILALLPLSFDAGLSQLTTGFLAGASVVLMDYLLAGDVVKAVQRHAITGITGVPPLWAQLADARWPDDSGATLRYFATTGGVMPKTVLAALRSHFRNAQPFLMYGLTEAFRSTYLPPAEIDRRPDSIGKAIPNAEVLVLREDGSVCDVDEPGELVHRGVHVALGYWNRPEANAKRFRILPGSRATGGQEEYVVWSGDTVVRDADGYLYFRGRRDEMIKTSGYRVSPEEIERTMMRSDLLAEVVAVGMPDERLGHAITLVAVARHGDEPADKLLAFARAELPAYMVPASVVWRDALPRNANGKFDRVRLREELASGEPG